MYFTGSCSDASIFAYTDLSTKIRNNELDTPASLPLSNTDVNLPLAFVADEIFGMSNNLLKPYSRRQRLGYTERIFNYRLKRARLTIECAFGILTSRYQILRQPLKFDISISKSIAVAAMCLHNYILNASLPHQNENIHLNYHNQPEVRMTPTVQRNLLSQFFTAPVGAVPWQDAHI